MIELPDRMSSRITHLGNFGRTDMSARMQQPGKATSHHLAIFPSVLFYNTVFSTCIILFHSYHTCISQLDNLQL